MGIIVFLAIISIIILVHESGHLLVAKAVGIKVEKFSIGFIKIFGKKFGETEYQIGLLPLGGYVAQNPESFEQKSPFLRLLMIVAGVTANFILAIVLVWFVFLTGFPALKPIVGQVLENSPAYSGGLQPGDIIKKIDGQEIGSWNDASKIIFQSPDKKLCFEIIRKEAILNLYITPEKKMVAKNPIETKEGGIIGVVPSGEQTKVSYSFTESFTKSVAYNYELLRLNTLGIAQMFKGKLSVKENLAGPIGIATATNTIYKLGWTEIILWTAMLSLVVGFMNILPIPVLDGGYVPFLLFEIIFRKKVNKKVMMVAQYIGLFLILALFLFATFSDILRIFAK